MNHVQRLKHLGLARAALLAQALVLALVAVLPLAVRADPTTVHFLSADGTTALVAYRFRTREPGPRPVVVMLHGRAGPYSSAVNAGCTQVGRGVSSPCSAHTLSMRHKEWGEHWAQLGYDALLVDSFGPRGLGHGFGRGTHGDADREAVNELTVRPLDAEGALAWLGRQPDVMADRIYLQGWSNGASTVLNTLHRQGAGQAAGAGKAGLRFRAAAALYPGCGPKATLDRTLTLDVPLLVLVAGDDEEVSPQLCEALIERSRGPLLKARTYPGATHDFDDPGSAHQKLAANRAAKADALKRVTRQFAPPG